MDPVRLDHICSLAYANVAESSTALAILADLAKERTTIEVLLTALLSDKASETTISYCFITLKQLFSRNGRSCDQFIEQCQTVFLSLAESFANWKPSTINSAAHFFALVFRAEPKLGVNILSEIMNHGLSNIVPVLTFALWLSCESGCLECLEPFVGFVMQPFLAKIVNPSDVLNVSHCLDAVLSQFPGAKFPCGVIDVLEKNGGPNVLFESSIVIDTPSLIRVIRTLVELPSVPFRNEYRRVRFHLECLKGYVRYVSLGIDRISDSQLTELSLLNIALRNCPCVRFLQDMDLFMEYIVSNQKLGLRLFDGKLLESGCTALEHWLMFWSTAFEFRCVIENPEAKSFLQSTFEQVANDIHAFLTTNSVILLHFVELDASSCVLEYIASVFKQLPIDQVFAMALRSIESDEAYFACIARCLSLILATGGLCDSSVRLHHSIELLKAIVEMSGTTKSDTFISSASFVLTNLMKFLSSKPGHVMFEEMGQNIEYLVALVRIVFEGIGSKQTIRQVVTTLQFQSFPNILQVALAHSELYPILVECEYFSCFSRDQANLFYTLMSNVISIIPLKPDFVMAFFEKLFLKLAICPDQVLITLKVGFESPFVNHARLFHLYLEHFHGAVRDVSCTRLGLLSSLVRVIAGIGESIGLNNSMSVQVMSWYRYVIQYINDFLSVEIPPDSVAKVFQNLLGAMSRLVKCRALNIGVMSLYHDTSFFETVSRLFSRMEELELSQIANNPNYLKKLLAFCEYYCCDFVDYEPAQMIYTFLLKVMCNDLSKRKGSEIRLFCFVLNKIVTGNANLSNDTLAFFMNVCGSFFQTRYSEELASICYRLLERDPELSEENPLLYLTKFSLSHRDAMQYLRNLSAENI